MPRESFEELLTPANDDSPSSEACAAAALSICDEMVYDGKNMESIVEMLSFLNTRLDVVGFPLSLRPPLLLLLKISVFLLQNISLID